MLELFRKNMHLYVKVLMNLRIPIKYQNKVFDVNEKTELLLTDEVMAILTKNGNIKLWNGKKFIKLNLGQFYDVIQNNNYTIVDYVEPKVEVKQPAPVVKKEEPKVEVQQVVKKEEPKVEVKQPEVKKEEPKVEVVEQPEVKKEEPKKEVKQPEVKNQQKHDNRQNENNENKKQRHNNNNNNKQGGGK